MRKYLLSAAVLTLMTTPGAWGDPPAGHGNRGNEGRMEQGHQGPSPGAMRAPDRGNRGPAPQAAMPANRPDRGDNGRGFERREQDRRAFNENDSHGNRGPQMSDPPNRGEQARGFDRGNRAPQAAIQAPPNRGDRDRSGNDRGNPPVINRQASRDFNRDGRTDFRPNRTGPRHDFSGFRDYHRNFQASRRFQVPSYRRPAGWYSRRWVFGEILPPAFWIRDYWLIDFEAYDLPPPPYGAVWVRVDHDALLIDEETGEIITVAYDVFY